MNRLGVTLTSTNYDGFEVSQRTNELVNKFYAS